MPVPPLAVPGGADRPVARHTYGLASMTLFCLAVLGGPASLNCTSRLMELMAELFHLPLGAPHATTGRHWLLRLGYFKLTRAKAPASDWVWLVDHTVQIGQERCLMIAGVRLSELPPPGACLELQDLEPMAILPVAKSDKHLVAEQLEATAEKTGVPRAILSDQGGDLVGGIASFCQAHPQTVGLSDIAHKAACILKSRLEHNDRWNRFCSAVGQTKFQSQQTELAMLVPPSQRSKARYMNLQSLLQWAQRVRQVLDAPPAEMLQYCTLPRLEDKFGWLRQYDDVFPQWWEYHQLLQQAIDVIRHQGYSAHAPDALASQLATSVHSDEGKRVVEEIVAFVRQQSSKAQPGERLPGSSEVLESAFGKFKALEGEHHKGGFTSLLLAFAAMLGPTTSQVIQTALEGVPTKLVKKWCADLLGKTVKAKRLSIFRRLRHGGGATKPGSYPA